MKSKSPFKAKVDIFQGSTSTYRHPSTVIQPIVGAQVGAQIAKTASEVTVKAIASKSKKPKKQFDFKVGPKPEPLTTPPYEHDFSQEPSGRTGLGYRTTKIDQANTGVGYGESFNKLKKGKDGKALPTGDFKGGSGKDWEKYVRNYNTKNINQERDEEYDSNNNLTSFSEWRNRSKLNSPNTMKGSPVKHNAKALPKGFFAKTQASLAAAAGNDIKSQGPDRGGVSAEDFASGNYAKPADAIDAASVDTFTPPPNQVAETGSYSGGRDRILEMDSNPVVNQSIGRDTNIASQLFGSGQRASMLAMKGSPMHAHTPTHGKKYKKGDLIDESDFETLGTGYNVQNISDIQEDKKGQFMTTLGDSEQKAPPIKSRPKSRIIDYPDPKGSVRDTIRPKVGKFFKKTY